MSTNQITIQKLHLIVRLLLKRKQWKTGSYTWAFLDTWELPLALHVTQQRTPNCMAWIQIGVGLAPCWEAEKLQPQSQEKHCRGMWPSGVHIGAFCYTCCAAFCREIHRGTRCEWVLYTGVSTVLNGGKFPNTLSQLLQEVEYGTAVVW